MYVRYKDNPTIKDTRSIKRRTHKLFRKVGKQKLDNAPIKYIGCKSWYY